MSEKVILLIRDGWGYRSECELNSICETPTPYTDKIMGEWPNTLLDASGPAVGLPIGYQGNSEVGHMTIGSGRIILQSLEKINQSIEEGEFDKNEKFLNLIENSKEKKSKIHVMGLLQSEGVHSHENHLHAFLRLCAKHDFQNVPIHVFTDGRDSPVTDSLKHLKLLEDVIKETGVGVIATVSGRYYSMDRNNVWERTRKAYDCIADGLSECEYVDVKEYVNECHRKGITDEFIMPTKLKGYEGVKDDDGIFFFNFRTDRTRQLTKALVEISFDGWVRDIKKIRFVAMTQYYRPMNAEVAFEDHSMKNLLGEVVSNAGLKQLRISETEKYAHVTFFFNGQIEEEFPGEDRELIQSPHVATYDLKPEMSVYEITEKLTAYIHKSEHDLIVVNLVNADMVGHTGITEAIHKAVAAVDECVGKIVMEGLKSDYKILIFADHGNAEDQTPMWRTSHTLNPVPFILIGKGYEKTRLKKGLGLKDIAPTALEILGLEKPPEMSGESIIDLI